MTFQEYKAKQEIIHILNEQGYSRYADLLELFHVNFTHDPDVIAYMEPSKGRIVINAGIHDADQISLLVRHEILHEYLDHMLRMERHVGKDKWDNRTSSMHRNSNIAGDYEISNRAYTKKDMRAAKHIRIEGRDEDLAGLVTELDHPEWVDLTLEEIYDRLSEEQEKEEKEAEQDIQQDGFDASEPQDGQQGQSSGQSQNGQGGKQQSQPQIGDTGNSEIQEMEEIQRQAEDISEQIDENGDYDPSNSSSGSNSKSNKSSKNGNSNSSGSAESGDESDEESEGSASGDKEDSDNDLSPEEQAAKDAMDRIADAAEETAQALKDEQGENGPKIYKDKEEQRRADILSERVQRIKDAFNDAKMGNEIIHQAEEAVYKEQQKQAERNAKQYRDNPLTQFKLDLNTFIKKEISRSRGATWTRPSKKYDGTGIFHKGRKMMDNGEIPLINVYFDRSGSWDDAKTAVGESAIAQLNQYVRRGEIKINVYYFAVNVHTDKASAEREGGTRGEPILRHILQTKPDNVVVMTDSDIGDCSSDVTVDGGVWFLFKGGVSKNLQSHLHGKKQTRSYEI